jgi:rfaE bifunctional protein kinase chain/domain
MKKILITGNFNILHPGHLRLFRFAKGLGGRLIVAVSSDRISGDDVNVLEAERLEYVRLNPWVDEAIIYDENIEYLVKRIKPDIIVKGKEHEGNFNEEKKTADEIGAKLVFGSGETVISSFAQNSNSLDRSFVSSLSSVTNYLDRHNLSKSQCVEALNGIQKLKVCVVGDLILDQYTTCEAIGMSREEPTIVATPLFSNRYLGGAGIVAGHCAAMGSEVYYFALTGDDQEKEDASKLLNNYQVIFNAIVDSTRPTSLKTRFRADGRSLFRLNQLSHDEMSKELQSQYLPKIKDAIDICDLILLSDFSYGTLPRKFITEIIDYANLKNKVVCADSQSSSQMGDILKFKNIDLITPTEYEARSSMKNSADGLVVLSQKIIKEVNVKYVLIKMGSEGVMINKAIEDDGMGWHTDQLVAINPAPIDVSGAGDSMLALSSMVLAVSENIWLSSYLGSIASAVQVGRVGNIPIKKNEIMQLIQ